MRDGSPKQKQKKKMGGINSKHGGPYTVNIRNIHRRKYTREIYEIYKKIYEVGKKKTCGGAVRLQAQSFPNAQNDLTVRMKNDLRKNENNYLVT